MLPADGGGGIVGHVCRGGGWHRCHAGTKMGHVDPVTVGSPVLLSSPKGDGNLLVDARDFRLEVSTRKGTYLDYGGLSGPREGDLALETAWAHRLVSMGGSTVREEGSNVDFKSAIVQGHVPNTGQDSVLLCNLSNVFSGEENNPVPPLPARNSELVYVDTANPVVEVEPLAVCTIQSGREVFSASLDSSDWVLGMMSSFRHKIGLSCVGHEADLEALFAVLEKERGIRCPKTPCKTREQTFKRVERVKICG